MPTTNGYGDAKDVNEHGGDRGRKKIRFGDNNDKKMTMTRKGRGSSQRKQKSEEEDNDNELFARKRRERTRGHKTPLKVRQV